MLTVAFECICKVKKKKKNHFINSVLKMFHISIYNILQPQCPSYVVSYVEQRRHW